MNSVINKNSYFEFDKTTGTIIKYNSFGETHLIIPREIEGVAVKNIGQGAFKQCNELKFIDIQEGIENIRKGAFAYCENLEYINISEGVKLIGENAFLYCEKLKFIIIPERTEEIRDCAFSGCKKLKNISMPEGVNYIGEDVFSNCISLTSISMAKNIGIYEGLFYGCINLESINIDDLDENYRSKDGVLFSKDLKTLILYPLGKKGNYIIPDSVEKIEDRAFKGCIGLTSISIPDSVEKIGEGAFKGCKGLTSMSISAGVEYIERYAFEKCGGLDNIEVDDLNTNYKSKDGVLFSKDFKNLIYCPVGKKGEYKVENEVEYIGERAFKDCKNITSISISKNIMCIEYNSFEGCNMLKDIYYGGSEEQWDILKENTKCLKNIPSLVYTTNLYLNSDVVVHYNVSQE
ncbi:MAG: leucine-rich repeat domain-containing protein [bacterium]